MDRKIGHSLLVKGANLNATWHFSFSVRLDIPTGVDIQMMQPRIATFPANLHLLKQLHLKQHDHHATAMVIEATT